jgi:GMP synthase (glutamine-hydrolysing)
MDKILILDFGSQTTQLIGRRIRDLGVYAEIVPGDCALSASLDADVKGIVLSGSPESVYDKGAAPDKKVYDCGLPLLGICYGLQRMTHDLGGKVEPLPEREYGRVGVTVDTSGQGGYASQFLKSFSPLFTAWMSHGDTLTRLAPGFKQYGTSATGYPAVVVHEEKPWFGLQFHPEVTHCEDGVAILSAFVFGVCGCKAGWSMEHYAEELSKSLKERAGENPVLLLISGGVDSTVAGAALLKSLKEEQVHLMYLDTGLMRKNETALVRASLEKLGAKNLHVVFCEEEFLSALKGVSAPEEKRGIIGDLFITIQER